ncbi:YpfB family protein [Bacillus velezensis]|nr:YpfB family protein [Bacillus velezensis]UTQ07212.1 YpfB family protein [Bacillus amyloliquefaciens]MCE4148607.1 YpfB family protein [Bacillus velezensis]MCE4148608.1 YpfB family protein [Bacillus velezensis]MDJ1630975.1 YpfB family protein [Bacillus velezensis]
MKTFERLLVKLVCIQLIILGAVQFLLHYQPIEPYISKAVKYEGVDKMEKKNGLKR